MRRRPVTHGIIVVAVSLLGAVEARGVCGDEIGDPFDTTVWMSPFLDCTEGCPFNTLNTTPWWANPWFRYYPHNISSYDSWCEWPTVPHASQASYIFRGAVATLSPGDSEAISGDLYIGGWSGLYDDANGNQNAAEHGDTGELRITGSSLTITGCISSGTDCYERVGYRGGYGKVLQDGGTHTVENSISFGMGSECVLQGDAESCIPCAPDDDGVLNPGDQLDAGDICGEGEYEFDSGQLIVGALDIGVQGKGTFKMTGGNYRSTIIPDVPAGTSFVGRAYDYPNPTVTPLRAGDGLFEQSGGEFKQGIEFSVGAGPRAIGIVNFSGSAYFFTQDLVAGHNQSVSTDPFYTSRSGGEATITQTGGTVEVNRHLILGESPRGVGRYTISGGTLRQKTGGQFILHGDEVQVQNGVHVGIDYGVIDDVEIDPGRGELTVDGKDATIVVTGVYKQGSNSLLTVKPAADSPHLSSITVQGVATFAEGAWIKIDPHSGYVPGYRTIAVLSASQIVGAEGIELDAPTEWELTVVNDLNGRPTLYALNTHLTCGLLGIEPVLVLGLLHATRRIRRRARGSVVP